HRNRLRWSVRPMRLLRLQLDDGRELAPRRVADDDEDALDDDRREDVEARVCLVPGELDGAQIAGRSRGVDDNVSIVLVGPAVGDEDEATNEAAIESVRRNAEGAQLLSGVSVPDPHGIVTVS